MSLLDLVNPNDLTKVARLQFLAKQVVEGLCSGRHRSPHKGFSVEFKEHRQYVRGDELKNIDWQAYAKSDRLYIREFEEETNLRCTLLVDVSGSMRYAGDRSGEQEQGGFSKHDYAQLLSASLAYLLVSQQDSVGAITFDDRIRNQVPARSRPSHLTALMKVIAGEVTHRETDLGGVLKKIAPKLGRRGLIIILSDAMGEVDSLGRALAQLRSSHHEVMFFQILDPDEVDFPFSGRVQFRDLENSENQRIVDARTLRQRYLERLKEHQDSLTALCRKQRVELVRVVTNESMTDVLHQCFARRGRYR